MLSYGRAGTLQLVVALIAASCTFDHGDQIDTSDPTDFTEFGGVSIVGQKIVDGVKEPPDKIDLVHLQATLFSECADVTAAEDAGFYKMFCKPHLGKRYPPTYGRDYCEYQFCLQHLYRCTGFKALEVAENVGVYTTSADTFGHTSQVTNDFYTFSFTGGREGTVTTYKIPPLSGEAKSLALLAANGMFRASLMQGAAARTTVWQGTKTCLDRHYESTNSYPSPAGGDITDMDRYVVAMSESLARLAETTQSLVGNQVTVASSFRSKYASSTKGQDAMWTGKINSRTSALRLLVGDPEKKTELCGCKTEINRSS